MSTSINEAFNIERISDRKCAYGIDGLTIDGNNLVEVFNTVHILPVSTGLKEALF